MDTKRVLYFLGLLYRETHGFSEEIIDLFDRALDENDDIIHLKNNLYESSFYHESGKMLFAQGKSLLEQVYSRPLESLDILSQIRHINENIDHELNISAGLMASAQSFSDSINVLKNADIESYMEALRMIASVSVYLMALYQGMDALKELSWNDAVGIQEMLYAINTKFLPALERTRRPNYAWLITKCKLGGGALLQSDGFFLSTETAANIEILCRGLKKEPIGTHAFLNTVAFEADENNVPYCWGVGNLVSTAPDHTLQLLSSGAVTKLRSPSSRELMSRMQSPSNVIRKLSDGAEYVITPDELCRAMNQWRVGYEINLLTSRHYCPICGKYVGAGRMSCSSHFTTEL